MKDSSNSDSGSKNSWIGNASDCAGGLSRGNIVDRHYRVLDFLGSGGAGGVYLVEHVDLGLHYAMKVLHEGGANAEKKRLRFFREAKLAARLDHPGIVRIVQCGVHNDDMFYYIMELVEGESLQSKLKREAPLGLEYGLDVALCLSEALQYAHSKGVIHRDIKPANICLTAPIVVQGRRPLLCQAKLLDFGLARSILMDEESLGLTGSRDIIGTPVYISPEQSIGKTIDARTDYYSLGVTLFEIFAGAPPLLGETAMETMILHQEMYPPLIRDINSDAVEPVPDSLEEVIARCLAKKPQDRYQSGQELHDDLLSVKNELFPPPQPESYLRTIPGKNAPVNIKGQAAIKKEEKKKTWQLVFAASSLAVLVLAVVAYFVFNPKSTGNLPTSATAASATTSMTLSKSDQDEYLDAMRKKAETITAGSYRIFDDQLEAGTGAVKYKIPAEFAESNFKVTSKELGTNVAIRPDRNGILSMPPDGLLGLKASENLMMAPDFIKGFDHDSIKSIELPKGAKGINKFLSQCAYFDGLVSLDAQYTDFSDSSLQYLNAFPKLAMLNISYCNVTADGIAKLNNLPNFVALYLAQVGGSDNRPYLQKLSNKSFLNVIAFSDMTITKEEFHLLSQCPHLSYVILRRCKISEDALPAFAPAAPHMITFECTDIPYSAGLFEGLSKLKNLKILLISGEGWNEEGRARLAKLLPGCLITLRAPDDGKTPRQDIEY